MKFFNGIIFLLVLSSCANQRKHLDSWLGHDKHSLIMAWGPPAQIADDGDGGQILIYGHHVYSEYLHLNYWDYKMMYIDKSDKIYYWRTSRQPVPPTEINVTLLN